MTVNYQLIVSSVSAGTFFRLLFRWRGSIWKSVITELSIWLVCYYLIFFCYRFLATASFQTFLEHLMNHMDDRLKYIPLTFMLGFFVTTVFERWRAIMTALPFIESVAISTSMLVPGLTEEARLIRRAIIRYVVLSQVLVFRDISMRVRRRFPNILSLVEAGFLEESELDDLEAVHARPGNRYWVPMNWANSIILEAHQNKIIDQPTAFNNLILALKEFRISLETLCKYDWIPIPIAYPQVVFLAVRVYFVVCLLSRQFIISEHLPASRHQMDIVFPVMTVFEFIFIVGWMKVAEGLLNPLGEDDDDFEANYIIDRNIATGMAIVDDTHAFHPPIVVDKFADPSYKPSYSAESQARSNSQPLAGSATAVELAPSTEAVKMVHVEPVGKEIEPSSREGSLRRRFSEKLPRIRTSSETSNKSLNTLDKRRPITIITTAPVSPVNRNFLTTLNEEQETDSKSAPDLASEDKTK